MNKVILVGNLTNGFSTDINSYMFGSITTATINDLNEIEFNIGERYR